MLGAVSIWKRPESFMFFPPEIHGRTIEWLALEGTVKPITFHPCHVQGGLPFPGSGSSGPQICQKPGWSTWHHPKCACCFQNMQARGKDHLWRAGAEAVTAALRFSRACFGSLASAPAVSAEMCLCSGLGIKAAVVGGKRKCSLDRRGLSKCKSKH